MNAKQSIETTADPIDIGFNAAQLAQYNHDFGMDVCTSIAHAAVAMAEVEQDPGLTWGDEGDFDWACSEITDLIRLSVSNPYSDAEMAEFRACVRDIVRKRMEHVANPAASHAGGPR